MSESGFDHTAFRHTVVGGYHYQVTVSHQQACWEMKSGWIEAILHEAIIFNFHGSPKFKTHNCQANYTRINEQACFVCGPVGLI